MGAEEDPRADREIGVPGEKGKSRPTLSAKSADRVEGTLKI